MTNLSKVTKINGKYELIGFEPGTPIKIVSNDAQVFGRVDHTDGGIVYLITPHGSLIRAGAIYVHKLSSKEDLESLTYFDKLKLEKDRKEGRYHD